MYGRTLADVLMADGTNVNHMLVKDGWCWSICPEADNLSTLKRFQKYRSLASFYRSLGQTVRWQCNRPVYIMVHICLKDRPQMKFGADGIPFAQVK